MQENPIRRICIGIGIAVIGLLLTGGGYLFAALREGGGTYFIFWGVVVAGIIYAGPALSQLPSYWQSQRSSDPWERARFDPNTFMAVLGRGLYSADVDERRRATAHLHHAVVQFALPATEMGSVYGSQLVDEDSVVRAYARQALRQLVNHDDAKGRAVLTEVHRWAGGEGGTGRYRDRVVLLEWITRNLITNENTYQRWKTTGALVEPEADE